MTNRVKILKEKFSQSLGLPFQSLLPQSEIQKVLDELKIKYRQRLFDPIVTLWAFLSQVLEPNTVQLVINGKSGGVRNPIPGLLFV